MKYSLILTLVLWNIGRVLCFNIIHYSTSQYDTLYSINHGYLPRHFRCLFMGYLDDISSPPSANDDEEDNMKSNDIKPRKSSGIVPSGRGGLRSHLNVVETNGNEESEEDPEEEPIELPTDDLTSSSNASTSQKLSGSGSYLTKFLTGEDDPRTDVRNLLTQRSIQSFMRLCEECRDPHSAKWITDDFLQSGNLLDYHGTGSKFLEDYGGLWDAPLLSMIKQPNTRIIVSAKRRGRGHGGWSKDNPFLEERWMEMPIDINPSNLASRILAVREQIALEWVTDLDVLIHANGLILDSFFQTVKRNRDEEGRANYSSEKSLEGDENRCAFERTAMYRMNDVSRFATIVSSPFRRSNFDLLYNLCTQAAVHRILREMKSQGNKTISFLFLRDWYTDRAHEYFDGQLEFGQADDFIDDLLQTPPYLLSTQDGNSELVDPVGCAEMIIKMREKVAKDWQVMMKRVSKDHTGLRQALLSSQMQVQDSAYQSLQKNDDETTFQ